MASAAVPSSSEDSSTPSSSSATASVSSGGGDDTRSLALTAGAEALRLLKQATAEGGRDKNGWKQSYVTDDVPSSKPLKAHKQW